jgi:hypothetical protein
LRWAGSSRNASRGAPAQKRFQRRGLLPCATLHRENHTGAALATRKEMSDFLASVERRAFKQSVYSVHD